MVVNQNNNLNKYVSINRKQKREHLNESQEYQSKQNLRYVANDNNNSIKEKVEDISNKQYIKFSHVEIKPKSRTKSTTSKTKLNSSIGDIVYQP